MKINFVNLTRLKSGKGINGIITRKTLIDRRMLMLFILVFALAACTRPQQASSGAGRSDRSSGTSVPSSTPTPSGDAGGAILNLERSVTFYYPNGSDFQSEVGAIKLEFFKSTEGDLIVEGAGKTEWTEIADLPDCKFTGKAEGKVVVYGLFTKKDCKFHLTIATKFSQPTTSNQSANCTGLIVFSETEFSSQIVLDPTTGRFIETKNQKEAWWEVVSVTLSDLKSDEVKFCFTPDVIP